MKAIVVTDQAAGTAGMKLAERPEPPAAINDVIVQIHASGFVPTEMAWPSTWTDRRDRDRTPSIPGHELAGVVTALGYGTTGLSVGQRVFGLADWHRDGTLAEYVAIEARNLAPLPGDVDFTVGASLPISGLTAWQGLFEHGRLQAGQSVLALAACGSGRSTSFIPAVPAAWSVTTIAFMLIFSLGHLSLWWKCCRDGKPVRHLMPGAMGSFRKRRWNATLPLVQGDGLTSNISSTPRPAYQFRTG